MANPFKGCEIDTWIQVEDNETFLYSCDISDPSQDTSDLIVRTENWPTRVAATRWAKRVISSGKFEQPPMNIDVEWGDAATYEQRFGDK